MSLTTCDLNVLSAVTYIAKHYESKLVNVYAGKSMILLMLLRTKAIMLSQWCMCMYMYVCVCTSTYTHMSLEKCNPSL